MGTNSFNNRISINDSDVNNINVSYNVKSSNDSFLHVGVFGFLIDVVCYLIGSKREKKEREYFKKITYDPATETYLDQYATRRSIKDDKFIQVNRNAYGETEIRYQNGCVRNLNQEKYNNTPGTVTRLSGYSRFERAHYYKTAVGYRYRDRINGKIYCIRCLKYKDVGRFRFYMDVENGLIIRPTDGQYKIEEEARKHNKKYYTNNDFKEMITHFNNHINKHNVPSFYRNDDSSCDVNIEDIPCLIEYRKEICR